MAHSQWSPRNALRENWKDLKLLRTLEQYEGAKLMNRLVESPHNGQQTITGLTGTFRGNERAISWATGMWTRNARAKRFLSIFSVRILDSSVDRGMPTQATTPGRDLFLSHLRLSVRYIRI